MNSEIGVPDGGWGWAVVTGTAIINVFNQSLLSMFGLIFGVKLQNLAGTTGVTTVMSVNCTITNFSGFLISPLSKLFSTRQITQIGVFLVASGLLLSGYTNSYIRIMLGYGVLTGLGLGLIASSTFLIINSYFDKNKSQAVGLAMAGTSVGQMGMPPVVASLLENFGYNGTTLILAGLSLNGFVGAMFFEPVKKHLRFKNKEDNPSRNGGLLSKFSFTRDKAREDTRTNRDLNDETPLSETGIGVETGGEEELLETAEDVIMRNKNVTDGRVDQDEASEMEMIDGRSTTEEDGKMLAKSSDEAPSCWKKTVQLFDLQILLDPFFVHIMIGLSLAYTSSVSFSTFFPLFLTEDLNMTMIDASACMSTLSLLDFIGRIIVPLITRYFNASHRMTFIIASYILAICRSVLALQTSYSMVMLLSAMCGLARAATIINQNLVIAEYSKEAHVSSAVGLNMVSKGVFVLTIGRLLGMYKDSAHNYAGCIHILNVISMTVVASWSLEIVIKKIIARCRR